MMGKTKPPNPITQPASDTFDLFIREWQDKFNLRNWRVVRSSKPAGKGNMAEIASIDIEAMMASYRLGKDFGAEPVTQRSLEQIACHECGHVLLAPLIATCRDPKSSDEQVNAAEHALIHLLVALLVPEGD